MFGTLKPRLCQRSTQHREYRRSYCGLCKGMGDNFGQLTRALVSYDAVFVALLADGLIEEGAPQSRCRCPLLPVRWQETLRSDSPAMRYAAAMQVLLADQWLADRAMDGRRAARAARPLFAGSVEVAYRMLADLGVALGDLRCFEERQAQAEATVKARAAEAKEPGCRSPASAAIPTRHAIALIFEQMAGLPGIPERVRSQGGRESLRALGWHLGGAIYLIDALEDLQADHRRGAFNPCLDEGGRVVWARVVEARELLRVDLGELRTALLNLPLRRHRELLENVALKELPHQADRAARNAHGFTLVESARHPSCPVEGPWPARALATVVALIAFAWVWIWSIPALAKVGPRPAARAPSARTHDAGGASPQDLPPTRWDPRLVQPTASASSAATGPTAPGTNTPATASPPPAAPAPSTPGGAGPNQPGHGTSPWPNPCPSCCNTDYCRPLFDCCDVVNGRKLCGACSICENCNCCSNCDKCNPCSSCGSCCGTCNSCCTACPCQK